MNTGDNTPDTTLDPSLQGEQNEPTAPANDDHNDEPATADAPPSDSPTNEPEPATDDTTSDEPGPHDPGEPVDEPEPASTVGPTLIDVLYTDGNGNEYEAQVREDLMGETVTLDYVSNTGREAQVTAEHDADGAPGTYREA